MDLPQITNVKVGGIDLNDYPDFVDAHIESADYYGEEMTDFQLEVLNENFDFINECAHQQIINKP